MVTIKERRVNEATILDLKGTLLVPGDHVALVDAVSRCISNGSRLVVLNIAGLMRIDAAWLGALIRSRNLLASCGGELRLLNPARLVGDMLRRTRLDSVIPTLHVASGDHDPSSDGGPVRASAAASGIALGWGALWTDRDGMTASARGAVV
jgi:anti-anti-sigma factor